MSRRGHLRVQERPVHERPVDDPDAPVSTDRLDRATHEWEARWVSGLLTVSATSLTFATRRPAPGPVTVVVDLAAVDSVGLTGPRFDRVLAVGVGRHLLHLRVPGAAAASREIRAGRKVATAPPTLDAAFVAAANKLRTRSPLVVGGRSAGARSAARTAKSLGAVGCLALAFPLHPPGRPEKSRLAELRRARVATLVVQGERDSMGRPEEFPADLDLVVVPGADHSFRVPRRGPVSQEEALEILVESTLEWIVREVVGNAARR